MNDQEKYAQQIKQALQAIKDLKNQLQEERNKTQEPIAIVGMAFRFPGNANNEEELANILLKNIDAIEDIPLERYDNTKIYDENGVVGKSVLKQGGYLKNIDLFDAPFFDLTRVETESIDPQQRILLELTHEALENGGFDTQSLINSETGVFIGITSVDYQKKHFKSGDYNLVNPYSYTGSAVCANAGRISYTFGFQGPSVSIDTACSSSLVATHLAVQSLRSQETNMAIVGAANLILEPELSICFTALSGLSKDSRCRPFSNNANGFVRSEGAAIIILKRLKDAIANNDNILSIIKGSAVNQDGKSNGFTAPSVLAQTKLLQTAIKDAQIETKDIAYIEAHGTGTKIGDPIELEALSNVFSSSKTTENPLYIASIKSNIGHTESVAGLAGLIKNIISINRKIWSKNLHSDELNQLVDWENIPIKVVQENTTWQPQNKYVGVSSFGVTGTNAHVILGEYKNESKNAVALRNDIYILPLSAKSEKSLSDLVAKYIHFIQNSSNELEDICAMAALRRTHYKYRKAFVSKNRIEMLTTLADFINEEKNENKLRYDTEDAQKIIFIFPGQGAQWIGMALQLLKQEPIFKKTLEAFNDVLKKYADWDLFEILNANDESKLNELDIVQPTLVAIGIALSKLWQSKGIMPDAVIGHSLGEVAAACVAGIISLDEAVKIICNRSKLMKQVSGKGLMLATDLSYDEALERTESYKEQISIAVVNSNNSLVLSGDADAIQTIANHLENENRFQRLIKVDVASHSVHMQGIDEQLKNSLSDLMPQNTAIDFYSSVHKCKINGNILNAEYWKQNLRQTVHFKETILPLLQNYQCVCIEMSPHPVLQNSILQNIEDANSKSVFIPSFFKDKDDFVAFYSNIAKIYEHNIQFNWKSIYENINNFIPLPNYAWQKERYWFDEKPQISIANQTPTVDKKIKNLYTTIWKKLEVNATPIQQKNILLLNHDIDSVFFKKFQVECTKYNNNLFTHADDTVLFDIVIFSCIDNESDLYQNINQLQNIIKQFSEKNTKPTIVLLSSNALVVEDDTKNVALSSVLAGIYRTLRNEETAFLFKHIDIDDLRIANLLISLNQKNNYVEIAIRDNNYYIPKLSKIESFSPTQNIEEDKESTVLIVGGTSGLGLQLALDYSNKAYKNIVLVSRSGAKAETEEAIKIFNQNDTKIAIIKADYTQLNVVQDSIQAIEKSMPPIRTVVHTAVVLADGLFQNSTIEDVLAIVQAKVVVANNLYQYFKLNKNIRYLFFSSATSILGNMAQAVYAGANYYLDNLASHINNNGGNAIAVNWGNIGEIGLAAQDDRRGKALSEQGLELILKNELPPFFDIIRKEKINQIIPLKIDFSRWKESYKNTQHNSFFSNFVTQNMEENTATQANTLFLQKNIEAAKEIIQQQMINYIAQITKIASSKIKTDETFKSLGIDSLMALQLKNKIQAAYNLQLNVSSIWSYPTVEKYSTFLVEELKLKEHYATSNPITNTLQNQTTIETEVENMSLEELMKQLNEKI